MTQLSQQEISALEELKDHFEHSLENVTHVLENKFFPEQNENELGWLVRDNTQFDGGYQNDSVVRALNVLHELTQRVEKENSVEKVVIKESVN